MAKNKSIEKIIQQKKEGKGMGKFEKEIDELVYKLYDLTEDEIKIVEGK